MGCSRHFHFSVFSFYFDLNYILQNYKIFPTIEMKMSYFLLKKHKSVTH